MGNGLTPVTNVGRRADRRPAAQIPENKGAVRTAYCQENLGAEAGPSTGASPADANDGKDHRSTRGGPAATGGGSQLDPVHGCRRAGNHTAADADNVSVEKEPHTGDLQMWPETSAHGNPAHGRSGKIAKAGSRHSGPAETLQGETPQHRASDMELHEVEPGKAMPRTHGSSSLHTRQRHQGHAGADGAHGQGRGDPRFSCYRRNGSGQRQDNHVQTHLVHGRSEKTTDSGGTHGAIGLSGPEANRSKAATGKVASSTGQGAPGHDPGCGPMRESRSKGAPHSAPRKRPKASPNVMQQTIFTLGRVKQLESLPPGLNQSDLHKADAKKGKPTSGPSRAGGCRGAQPVLNTGETSLL